MASSLRVILAGVFLLGSCAVPAVAGSWNCNYSGAGGARYDMRLERHGASLIVPHWPTSRTYRILAENRVVLVAAHGRTDEPAFRRDPGGVADIVILNKRTGRLRISSGGSEEPSDEVAFGTCAPG